MKEVVSISRLQSMNAVRKRKKSQHLKGKGSKGGGEIETPIMALNISFSVIS